MEIICSHCATLDDRSINLVIKESNDDSSSSDDASPPPRRARVAPEALEHLARELRAAQVLTPTTSPSFSPILTNSSSSEDLALLVEAHGPSLPADLSPGYHQVPIVLADKIHPAPPSPASTTTSAFPEPADSEAQGWEDVDGWEVDEEEVKQEDVEGDIQKFVASTLPSKAAMPEDEPHDLWPSDPYNPRVEEEPAFRSIPLSDEPRDINLNEASEKVFAEFVCTSSHPPTHPYHQDCGVPDPLYYHPRALIDAAMPPAPPATPASPCPLLLAASDDRIAPIQHDDAWEWYLALLSQVTFLANPRDQVHIVFIHRSASYFAYTTIIQEVTHQGRLAVELGSTLPTWTALSALALAPTIAHSPWATKTTCISYAGEFEVRGIADYALSSKVFLVPDFPDFGNHSEPVVLYEVIWLGPKCVWGSVLLVVELANGDLAVGLRHAFGHEIVAAWLSTWAETDLSMPFVLV